MTCDEAVRSIARAIEGHAAFTELDALVNHLEKCTTCRPEAETQVIVKRVLASRPREALPPGLARRIAARLDTERSRVRRAFNWRKWTLCLVPVTAGLVLVAATVQRFNRTASSRIDLPSVLASWAHGEMHVFQAPWSADLSDRHVFGVLLMNAVTAESWKAIPGEDVGR
jgi:predicted anti-sigma-YlaC factor YlaD